MEMTMKDFDKDFKFMQRLFWVMFSLVLVFILVVFGIVFKSFFFIADQDYSHGIQPVANKLWCGKESC